MRCVFSLMIYFSPRSPSRTAPTTSQYSYMHHHLTRNNSTRPLSFDFFSFLSLSCFRGRRLTLLPFVCCAIVFSWFDHSWLSLQDGDRSVVSDSVLALHLVRFSIFSSANYGRALVRFASADLSYALATVFCKRTVNPQASSTSPTL